MHLHRGSSGGRFGVGFHVKRASGRCDLRRERVMVRAFYDTCFFVCYIKDGVWRGSWVRCYGDLHISSCCIALDGL